MQQARPVSRDARIARSYAGLAAPPPVEIDRLRALPNPGLRAYPAEASLQARGRAAPHGRDAGTRFLQLDASAQ